MGHIIRLKQKRQNNNRKTALRSLWYIYTCRHIHSIHSTNATRNLFVDQKFKQMHFHLQLLDRINLKWIKSAVVCCFVCFLRCPNSWNGNWMAELKQQYDQMCFNPFWHFHYYYYYIFAYSSEKLFAIRIYNNNNLNHAVAACLVSGIFFLNIYY